METNGLRLGTTETDGGADGANGSQWKPMKVDGARVYKYWNGQQLTININNPNPNTNPNPSRNMDIDSPFMSVSVFVYTGWGPTTVANMGRWCPMEVQWFIRTRVIVVVMAGDALQERLQIYVIIAIAVRSLL